MLIDRATITFERLFLFAKRFMYGAYTVATMEIFFSFVYLFVLLVRNGKFGTELQQQYTPAYILSLLSMDAQGADRHVSPLFMFYAVQIVGMTVLIIYAIRWVFNAYKNAQELAQRSNRRLWELRLPFGINIRSRYKIPKVRRTAAPRSAAASVDDQTILITTEKPETEDALFLRPSTQRPRVQEQKVLRGYERYDIDDEGHQWKQPFWDTPFCALLAFAIPYVNIIAPKFFLERMLYGFHESATGYAHRRWIWYYTACRVGIYCVRGGIFPFSLKHPPADLNATLIEAMIYNVIDAAACICLIRIFAHTNNSQEEFYYRQQTADVSALDQELASEDAASE